MRINEATHVERFTKHLTYVLYKLAAVVVITV